MRIIPFHNISFLCHWKGLSRPQQCPYASDDNKIQSCFAVNLKKNYEVLCMLMWPLTLKAGCCVAETPDKVSCHPADFWSLWGAISWCMALMNWLGEMLCWTWYSQIIKNRLKMWRLRDNEVVVVKFLRGVSKTNSRITSLDFKRAGAGTCLGQSHGKLLLGEPKGHRRR